MTENEYPLESRSSLYDSDIIYEICELEKEGWCILNDQSVLPLIQALQVLFIEVIFSTMRLKILIFVFYCCFNFLSNFYF